MANILMITAHFPPDIGGIQNTCFDLYCVLSQDHNVQVITRGDPRNEKDRNIHRLGRMGLPLFNLRSMIPAFRLIRKNNIDLILSGSLNTGFATGLAGSVAGIKSLSLAHGLDIIYPNVLYRLATKIALKRLDFISVNSRNTRRLLAHAGYPENNITIIPPAIPDKHVERLRNFVPDSEAVRGKYNLTGKPLLLSVGRLVPRKGLLPFVKNSFPLILKEIPDCQLLIAGDSPQSGKKGSEIRSIVTAARDLGIEENIQVLGFIDDEELMEIYHACDLFVFPVRDMPGNVEGYGIVAIEAALAGKPALGTKAGGIPDAIEDGKTGVLVDPGDYGAFASAAVDLLKDRQKQHRLGSAGKSRVLESLTWSSLSSVWGDLIETVLAK